MDEIVADRRDSMNLSSSAVTLFGSCGRSSPRFIRTKRAMFHTLFRKFRASSRRDCGKRIDLPFDVDCARANLSASIP